MRNILVFSIALNGYQWRYKTLLDSHRHYASRFNYKYIAVTRPDLSLLGMEVAWLKIKLIIAALNSNYEAVLFLDADTRVSKDAPPITTTLRDGADIYAAKGFSGRFNSGVLFIRNTDRSKQFFNTMLEIATHPLPQQDDVGWGENGHFIHLAKSTPLCAELDARWNNNFQKDLDDHVRHYSRGPLYNEFRPPLANMLLERLCHYSLAVFKRLDRLIKHCLPSQQPDDKNFLTRLDNLSARVLSKYPHFSSLE